ncbi:MAG TPA: hypothetical protein VF176_04735 [Solirubrobacterales bacterium]
MRDFLLTEALKRLAADAATHFSSLVATGEKIPFDVAEREGPDALFHSYVPLTARFVREHEDDVRALPSFDQARDAVRLADVAASYLEARGEAVPVEAGERAARMLNVFLACLWDGCTEFSLNRERLDQALAVLDAETGDVDDAEVLIAPIVGLKMQIPRLDLPHGVRVVRADAVEAPVEAMRSEGMGRAAWEPQFLALAEQGEGGHGTEEALLQLRELISVMRLFKTGGVGLGPYAFAPTGEGQWRRIATGAPATRSGGYQLSEAEASELAELAGALEVRPDPDGALAWAVGRFEMGCARETAMEGLSDHLLGLRAVLEGHGPVGASLPMRAAALISCDSHDRIEARERMEHALEIERTLMNGAPSRDGLELAVWIEESLRRMLREAALGELGADISTAADETLISAGLDAGDGAIVGTTSEWEIPDTGRVEVTVAQHHAHQEQETRIMEPIPGEDEIKITAAHWLDEVAEDNGSIEWTAAEGDPQHRERIDTPRVRHLFQVPEDADWEVRELDYDHYRRAG